MDCKSLTPLFLLCLLTLPFIPVFGHGYIRIFDLFCFGIALKGSINCFYNNSFPRSVFITFCIISFLVFHYVFIGGSLPVIFGMLRNLLYLPCGFYISRYISRSTIYSGLLLFFLLDIFFSFIHIFFPISRSIFAILYPDVEWFSALSSAPTVFFGDTTYNILGLIVLSSFLFSRKPGYLLFFYSIIFILSIYSSLLSYSIIVFILFLFASYSYARELFNMIYRLFLSFNLSKKSLPLFIAISSSLLLAPIFLPSFLLTNYKIKILPTILTSLDYNSLYLLPGFSHRLTTTFPYTLRLFYDNPIFGQGSGSGLDSFYLVHLASFGVVGTFVIISFLLYLFHQLYIRNFRHLFLLCILLLFVSFFQNPFFGGFSSSLLFFFIGFYLSLPLNSNSSCSYIR